MLSRALSPYAERAFALLRIVVGILFFLHGAQKTFGLLGGPRVPVGELLWVAGVIELVTGALVAIGFFARPAAFLASGEMAYAYVQHHWLGTHEFWPLKNQGELAMVYSFFFLYVACRGAGPWSVAASRRRGSTA